MSTIQFHYANVKPLRLEGKRALQSFLSRVFKWEGKEIVSINYIFCTDDYLLEINRSFLQHDYYTDIITFDLSETEGTVGEIYVSVDRVRENASTHGVSFRSELIRVLLHGILHLIGYKDKKKSEITIMREKEEYYLHLFASQ